WKKASKVCFYCDKEGHIKRDCEKLKALIETRKLLREAKEQKEKAKSIASNSPEIAF
ncbi:4914_t:CDS:1, partial [Racocetra persica]